MKRQRASILIVFLPDWKKFRKRRFSSSCLMLISRNVRRTFLAQLHLVTPPPPPPPPSPPQNSVKGQMHRKLRAQNEQSEAERLKWMLLSMVSFICLSFINSNNIKQCKNMWWCSYIYTSSGTQAGYECFSKFMEFSWMPNFLGKFS